MYWDLDKIWLKHATYLKIKWQLDWDLLTSSEGDFWKAGAGETKYIFVNVILLSKEPKVLSM